MAVIAPDAFFRAYKNPKATFECLKAFRRFYPETAIYLISDGGDDFGDMARHFECEYERLDRLGRPPWNAQQMAEWLRRMTVAAERGTSRHLMLLEEDVLIRGVINRSEHFAIAGPHHSFARLSQPLFEHLRARFRHLTSDHYGGCGGTLMDRQSLFEASSRFDFASWEFLAALDHRIAHSDVFLTLLFILAGHPYLSLEDVYCEATQLYPDWETDGRPIVHQYKRFYGQPLALEDLQELRP